MIRETEKRSSQYSPLIEEIKEKVENHLTKDILKPQRVEIKNLKGYTLVVLKEKDRNSRLNEVYVKLPKNIHVLPIKTDEQKYYSLLKNKRNVEAAILVDKEKKNFIFLIEMKSTLREEHIESIILDECSKLKCSLYLLEMILRFLEIKELDNFSWLLIIVYLQTILPKTENIIEYDFELSKRQLMLPKEITITLPSGKKRKIKIVYKQVNDNKEEIDFESLI